MNAVYWEHQFEPPLDYEALLGRCLGQQALAHRLLQRFLETFDESLSRLLACAQKREYATLAGEAHRWKGACLSVSAQPLGSLLAELEQAARNADELRVGRFVNEAHCLALKLRGYIEDLLTNQGDPAKVTVTCSSSPNQ